jgi:type 1 glutamine amidotransferase
MKKMSEEEKAAAKARELVLKENLMAYVKGGGGFVGIHAATDTFYEWKEYGEMMNGYFDGHPWMAGTQVNLFVEPGQEKHPLAEMFGGERLEFKEEIYQFKAPYDSSKVHMLLRLDPEKSAPVKGAKRQDNDYGVSWARNWEKGRVFYSSLGHNHEMYWHPKVVRHYLAGIQWAIGDYKAELAEGK